MVYVAQLKYICGIAHSAIMGAASPGSLGPFSEYFFILKDII